MPLKLDIIFQFSETLYFNPLFIIYMQTFNNWFIGRYNVIVTDLSVH